MSAVWPSSGSVALIAAPRSSSSVAASKRAGANRRHEKRVAGRVGRVDPRAGIQKATQDCGVAVRGRHVGWRYSQGIGGGHLRAGRNQRRHNAVVFRADGPVQRRGAVGPGGVDVVAFFQETANRRHVAGLGGRDKRVGRRRVGRRSQDAPRGDPQRDYQPLHELPPRRHPRPRPAIIALDTAQTWQKSHKCSRRPQAPGPRPQAPGPRPQAPGSRLQAPGSRLQAPGSRPQAPGPRPVQCMERPCTEAPAPLSRHGTSRRLMH